MLRKFAVENFKSFQNRWEFDLGKVKDYQFNTELINDGTVKTALLYGYNGSGKTNLGFAIMDLIGNLTDKNVHEEFYAHDYLNAYSKNEYAEFCYEFLFAGQTLEYSYRKKSWQNICREVLKLDGKILLQYDRNQKKTPECCIAGTQSLNLDLDQVDIPLLRYIRRNAALPQEGEGKILRLFFDFADRMLHFRNLDDRFYQGFTTGISKIGSGILAKGKLQDFQSFLQQANLNLELCEWRKTEASKAEIGLRIDGKILPFFPLISTGTLSLSLFYYWYQRCITGEQPSLIFIDEYDAFLHSEAARMLFEKLTTLKNTQSILSTHNLELFSNQDARPDCLFLMGEEGMAAVWQLANKSELRQVHNLAKLYKGGAFDQKLAQWKAEDCQS